MAKLQDAGPPKGSISATPGPSYDLDAMAKAQQSQLGPVLVQETDPGFMPPHDPLKIGPTKARAGIVYRDIPLVQVQNTWSVEQARAALYSHQIGLFEQSGQLVDSLLGDPRVIATTRSRVTNLFGRPAKFKPADNSDSAKEVCDAWEKHWPRLAGGAGLQLTHVYQIHMGWAASQITWDTSGPLDLPYLQFWHPRYTYYHWALRRYIALSQDGQIAIEPGDGKWLLHAPHGQYRGWIFGAIRPLTEPWLYRHFGARDMARFSEVHGLPTRKGKVPAASDPIERSQFEASLTSLGSDSAIIVPQGVDGMNSYDYELVEATDTAWESFPGLIDRADMDIVLAILMVNLTTEVKGGSFAATSAHMDKEKGGTEFDNQGWKSTIYNQLARPFAWMNYGDADLAPWTEWDVTSRDEYKANAEAFTEFGKAVAQMSKGGIKFTDPKELIRWAAERFDLRGLPDFTIQDPPAGAGSGGDGGFGA